MVVNILKDNPWIMKVTSVTTGVIAVLAIVMAINKLRSKNDAKSKRKRKRNKIK